MSDDVPLNLVDYLDMLEQPPAPAPVSLWPQTGGWIWLGLALLALVAWGVLRWRRRRRQSLYRRQALREVAAAPHDAAAIATILRRTALAAFPRHDVAGLQGDAWLAFLDASYPGSGFSDGPGAVIARAPYATMADAPGLAALATDWIHRHRPPAEQASP
ncbi:MAG: DUF4381 domain-containing protein [Bauldia litoralis]